MHGWLVKRGSKMPHRWQRRYFSVVDAHVGYFTDDAMLRLKGEFSITADTTVEPTPKRPHGFRVCGSGLKHKGGTLLLAAEDGDAFQAWMDVLTRHVKYVRQLEGLDLGKTEYGM